MDNVKQIIEAAKTELLDTPSTFSGDTTSSLSDLQLALIGGGCGETIAF